MRCSAVTYFGPYFNVWRGIVGFSTNFGLGYLCGRFCMLKLKLLGHWTVTLQGVLLAWTKYFKVRGVQDTDVVSSLCKALQKHKASFVPAGGEPEWPQIALLGEQLLVYGLFWELSDTLQGQPVTNA